jgi:hypothetical protein
MQERQPTAAAVTHDHFVAEHRAHRRTPELLDVGAAEPAREHLERRFGLEHLRELRPPARV